MPDLPQLGRLQPVDLRSLWADEARSFTPWLAEPDNLRLLGEALGMDLELVRTESEIGSFYADIVCRDTADGSHILIENQLERTDHTNLGQILTYAAGLDAVTVVWIAKRFHEAHRAALDWLNEHTVERVQFFGLEIEVYRIGGSEAAPKFQVVARPNDWSREAPARASSGRGETQEQQLRFWQGFREYCSARDLPFKPIKAQAQNWMDISIGRTDFALVAAISTAAEGEIRAEFVVRNAARDFAPFLAERAEIEKDLGAVALWDVSEAKKSAKIYYSCKEDPSDESEWPRCFSWLTDSLTRLHGVFAERVKRLAKA